MLFDNLRRFANTITSQNGEDGILEYLLNMLNIRDGYCCEFGAWDGKHLSNVYDLWANKNFNAVLIESDREKFAALLDNIIKHKNHKKLMAVNTLISSDISSSALLDDVLRDTFLPYDFDVLSIDIDGDDYNVWKSLRLFRPKIVLIEVNSHHPPGFKFTNVLHDNRGCEWEGTTISAMVDLAKQKQYELVCHLKCNAFFIQKQLYPLVNLKTNKLEDIYDYSLVSCK